MYEIHYNADGTQKTISGDLAVYEVEKKRPVSVNQPSYQRWLAAGNQPVDVPYVAPPERVFTVKEAQGEIGRKALDHIATESVNLGIIDAVMTAEVLNMHTRLESTQAENPSPRLELLRQLATWKEMIVGLSQLRKTGIGLAYSELGEVSQSNLQSSLDYTKISDGQGGAISGSAPAQCSWDAILNASAEPTA